MAMRAANASEDVVLDTLLDEKGSREEEKQWPASKSTDGRGEYCLYEWDDESEGRGCFEGGVRDEDRVTGPLRGQALGHLFFHLSAAHSLWIFKNVQLGL